MIRHLVCLSLVFLLVVIGSARDQYQCIIDSGSTGSRIYIYRYQLEAPLQTIEEVCSKRINPSISSFAYDAQGLREYLKSLITFAETKIDPSFHSSTSICLKGTAGLRTMPDKERIWIMNEVQMVLKNTTFLFHPVETRVLTGGEEALFGLLATNIAFSNLTNKLELSLGAGDLGGSSQQMAFVVQPKTFVRSFFDTYFGGILFGGTGNERVATTDKSNGSIISRAEEDATQDITDECLPNFAVTFPVPATGSVVDQFLSPLTSLVSTYSPAALFAASYNWFASSSFSNENSKIVAESKLSSTLSSHPALDSAFHSSLSGSTVTINIYAKSMAGMGLVAAMNETFYYIAEMHQKRIYNEKLRSQRTSTLRANNTQTFQCKKNNDLSPINSDQDEIESSVDLFVEARGTETCESHHQYLSSIINLTLDDEQPGEHSETIETNENNDGDHLYGEHSSWLHALHQNDEVLENPCAPPGINLPYPDALSTLRWQGTGDFAECSSYVKHLVQMHALRDRKCLRQWFLQLPVSFIMMDNFPKIFEVMQLPIDELSFSMSPAIVRLRGEDICQQPWTKLQDVYPDFPAYRVQQVCFAASFVYVLMTEVYGMSDIRDTDALNLTLPVPTWHKTSHPSNDGLVENEEKLDDISIFPRNEEEELDMTTETEVTVTDNIFSENSVKGVISAPTGIRFVAMDAHDSFTIGWSLGAAIVSAMNITYTEDLLSNETSFLSFETSVATTVEAEACTITELLNSAEVDYISANDISTIDDIDASISVEEEENISQ